MSYNLKMTMVASTEKKIGSNTRRLLNGIQEQISPFTANPPACSLRPIQQTNGTLTSLPLEELEKRYRLQDLTQQVSVMPGPPVDVGGFATVHMASYNGTLVAVKALKYREISESSRRATVERRLRREFQVWAALFHPNVANCYGFIKGFGDWPCTVSKWYENGDAYSYLKDKQLELTESRKLISDVANGLGYLHAFNIVHGDLTPKNILIDDEGVAQLCDFGLVKLLGSSGQINTGPLAGAPRYQAPELIRSKCPLKPRITCASDIYSFGCVAYEFRTGKYPFENCKFPDEVVMALKGDQSPALRPEKLEQYSEEKLWDLMESCWHSDADKRPNMEAVVAVLKEIWSADWPQPGKESELPYMFGPTPLESRLAFGSDGQEFKNTDTGNVYFIRNKGDESFKWKDSRNEQLKDHTFGEPKKTPFGQRASDLLGKILLCKRRKIRRTSSVPNCF